MPKVAGVALAAGLLVLGLVATPSADVCTQEDCGAMKRRQQGILTGMPFMTHVSARSFVDDTGRKLSLAKAPVRIVSLAPSITEMLFAIGAGGQVAGVTQFCDFPPEASKKPKIGYANPNLESLVALQPDLVLAPKEFLKPDLLASLDHLKIPTFILAGQTVDDIVSQIQTIGRMTDHQAEAASLTMDLRRQLAAITARMAEAPLVRVLYVLNSQPLITVGPGSYIDQLIRLSGGDNIASRSGTPYPRLSLEVVLRQDPEVLVFPVGTTEGISEGEQASWRQWTSMTAVKRGRLHQISADLLNRPGPRVVQALRQLADILHPELAFSPSQPIER